MTDKQTPPDWVLIEAAKRGAFREADVVDRQIWYQADKTFRALCDMIQKHEHPPVDRKILCAREARRAWSEDQKGMEVTDACAYAIELYLEGFGE